MDISGKVGLITGGAYGIGKKLTATLLQKGAKGVVILDINDKNGIETQREFEQKFGSGQVVYQKCDVTKKDQMEAGFQLAKSKYGQLNIVCNNAGYWDEVQWEKMFEVNINGVIYGTKLALENLDDAGVIINISSVAGLSLVPFLPMYATTKVAVLSYTRTIAKFDETVRAKKLRLNTLCPSAVDGTNLLPSIKVEENVKEQCAAYMKMWPKITTGDVANAFLKAIEEAHHDQVLFIRCFGKETHFVEDYSATIKKELFETGHAT